MIQSVLEPVLVPQPTKEPTTRLVEVFSSIQGEGMLVGHRQIFVRTYGCNLRCTYCDSPETLKESPIPSACRVEQTPGSWTFRPVANPISGDTLTRIVQDYLAEPHHSLSITGGEPLLHARFLGAMAAGRPQTGPENLCGNQRPAARPSGADYSALVDYVSMDFKAPSATGLSEAETWNKHRAFLQVARQTNVYGKLVITPATTDAELDAVTDTIAAVDAAIPLILQPVTPMGTETQPVSPVRMIALHARAARRLSEVRVIPQTHKMMQLL